jgi:very-short-patch-repair endonuclease
MRRISHLAALRKSTSAENARQLRSGMTDAERRLWYYLRAGRLHGFTFRRQVPLGSYVVDFLCEQARLVVELDGGQHAERVEYDASRTQWLNARGYRVVRFWNNDVLANTEGVMAAIEADLPSPRPSPTPCPLRAPEGEGEP